jgi:hypothetical protein
MAEGDFLANINTADLLNILADGESLGDVFPSTIGIDGNGAIIVLTYIYLLRGFEKFSIFRLVDERFVKTHILIYNFCDGNA